MSIVLLKRTKVKAYTGYQLAQVLGAKIASPKSTTTSVGKPDILYNYGVSKRPPWYEALARRAGTVIINQIQYISNSSNKKKTAQVFKEQAVPALESTESREVAARWLTMSDVYARGTVTGSSGAGITIVRSEDWNSAPTSITQANHRAGGVEQEALLPEAPLYTKLYPKTHEFRLHVAFGEVIEYTQKKKLSSTKRVARGIEFDSDIRTLQNGWIFAKRDLYHFDNIVDLAIQAAKALRLDVVAIDIAAIIDEGELIDCVVVEPNTAPSLMPSTQLKYALAFDRCFDTNILTAAQRAEANGEEVVEEVVEEALEEILEEALEDTPRRRAELAYTRNTSPERQITMPNSPITESLILSPVMERAPEEAEEVQDVEPSPSAAWIYPWTSTYVPNIST